MRKMHQEKGPTVHFSHAEMSLLAEAEQEPRSPGRSLQWGVGTALCLQEVSTETHLPVKRAWSDLPRSVGSSQQGFQDASSLISMTALLHHKAPLCNTNWTKCPTSEGWRAYLKTTASFLSVLCLLLCQDSPGLEGEADLLGQVLTSHIPESFILYQPRWNPADHNPGPVLCVGESVEWSTVFSFSLVLCKD